MKTHVWTRLKESMKSDGPFDPTYRFSTSWLVSPYILSAIRAVFSIYCFLALFLDILFEVRAGRSRSALQTLTFFPNLSYWGLAIYFDISCVHAFSLARWGKPVLARWPRSLQRLHSFFYTTIVVFPLLVTVEHVLMNGYASGYLDVSLYVLNTIFAVFEMIVPRTRPIPVWHVFPLLTIQPLYLAVETLARKYEDDPSFDTLFYPDDRASQLVNTPFFLISCLIQCVLFFVVHYIIKARVYFTEPTITTTVETNEHEIAAFGVRRLSDDSVQKQPKIRTPTVRVTES